MVEKIIWTIIKVDFFLVLISYLILLYEKLNSRQEIFVLDFLKSFILEFLSTVYIIFSWPFGFLPLEKIFKVKASSIKTPVILVHGYFLNRSSVLPLIWKLRREGFENIFPIILRPYTLSVDELAERLKDKVEEILDKTGESKVFIISHSFGGLVSRYFEMIGGKEYILKHVTIATPHKGTRLAYFGLGDSARDMRPGSECILELEKTKPSVPTLSISSLYDSLVIPSESAILPDAQNYESSLGHFSTLFSPQVLDEIVKFLR